MPVNKLKIIFKTRNGPKEGMGDVTSSVALARELRGRGNNYLTFITNNNKYAIDLIKQSGFECIVLDGLEQLQAYLSMQPMDIAILNQLNTRHGEALLFKRNSRFLVTIEDAGLSAKMADLRFNVLYPIKDAITDLRFIPLSCSFQNKHLIPKITRRKVKNILITQGGSDTYGFIPKIIKTLYSIPEAISAKVVIGPNFLFEKELSRALTNSPRSFDIVREETDLSELFLKTDVAVSAAGNTLFELACLGVPSVVVCGELFEVDTAKRLENEGFGVNLGFGAEVKGKDILQAVMRLIDGFDLRLKMTEIGRDLIDGQGTKRTAEKIKSAYKNKLMQGYG